MRHNSKKEQEQQKQVGKLTSKRGAAVYWGMLLERYARLLYVTPTSEDGVEGVCERRRSTALLDAPRNGFSTTRACCLVVCTAGRVTPLSRSSVDNGGRGRYLCMTHIENSYILFYTNPEVSSFPTFAPPAGPAFPFDFAGRFSGSYILAFLDCLLIRTVAVVATIISNSPTSRPTGPAITATDNPFFPVATTLSLSISGLSVRITIHFFQPAGRPNDPTSR